MEELKISKKCFRKLKQEDKLDTLYDNTVQILEAININTKKIDDFKLHQRIQYVAITGLFGAAGFIISNLLVF